MRERPQSEQHDQRREDQRRGPGLVFIRLSSRDAGRDEPQKTSVARVPSAPPAGDREALVRQLSCAQVNGSVHWVLSFGPVGPLKNAACFSPQRPSNPSHG